MIGTPQTPTLRATVAEGLEELRARAVGDREAGRVPAADALERFCDATENYIRVLENTVRAARETIRALEGSRVACDSVLHDSLGGVDTYDALAGMKKV